MLWFLAAVLKHVQASGRSKDALSDQTQSVNSFTGPTTFPNRPRASALSAGCTQSKKKKHAQHAWDRVWEQALIFLSLSRSPHGGF